MYVGRIAGVETVSALTRKLRRGFISQPEYDAALLTLRVDMAFPLLVVEITPGVLTRAEGCAKKHALRGFDAVQLAAAMTAHDERLADGLSPIILIGGDGKLLSAARAEGLTTDDPKMH